MAGSPPWGSDENDSQEIISDDYPSSILIESRDERQRRYAVEHPGIRWELPPDHLKDPFVRPMNWWLDNEKSSKT